MKASSKRRLIMLSSTMRTLMGGTAPSRTDAGPARLVSTAFLERFALGLGLGEGFRGAGGVAIL